MWKEIKAFTLRYKGIITVISVWLTVLGIIAKLSNLPTTLSAKPFLWIRTMMQSHAPWIIAIILSIYIIFMDFRPQYKTWKKRRRLSKTLDQVNCVIDNMKGLKVPFTKTLYSAKITNNSEKHLSSLDILVSHISAWGTKEQFNKKKGLMWAGTRPTKVGVIENLSRSETVVIDLLGLVNRSGLATQTMSLMSSGGLYFPTNNENETFSVRTYTQICYEFIFHGEVMCREYISWENNEMKNAPFSDELNSKEPSSYMPTDFWLRDSRVYENLYETDFFNNDQP